MMGGEVIYQGLGSASFSELDQGMRVRDDDSLSSGVDPALFFPDAERTTDRV